MFDIPESCNNQAKVVRKSFTCFKPCYRPKKSNQSRRIFIRFALFCDYSYTVKEHLWKRQRSKTSVYWLHAYVILCIRGNDLKQKKNFLFKQHFHTSCDSQIYITTCFCFYHCRKLQCSDFPTLVSDFGIFNTEFLWRAWPGVIDYSIEINQKWNY